MASEAHSGTEHRASTRAVALREYFLNESIDIAQPNVRDIGGYTGGLRAVALAQAFNIQLEMGGNYPHLNMHLHAGVPNGGRVEFHLGGWRICEALFEGAPAPVQGWITLPSAPGLRFTPSRAFLTLPSDDRVFSLGRSMHR